MVPGITAASAAAAAAGCSFTVPGATQSLIMTRMPGRTPMPAGEQAAAFARTGATLAFFLSTGKVADLMAELQDAGGLAPDTPAAAVYRASWPDEQVVRGMVADLARKVEEAGFRRQSLILVGRALAASTTVSRLYDGSFSHGYRNSLPDEAFHGTCALYAASPAGLAQARTLAAALTQGDAPAPVIFAAWPMISSPPRSPWPTWPRLWLMPCPASMPTSSWAHPVRPCLCCPPPPGTLPSSAAPRARRTSFQKP